MQESSGEAIYVPPSNAITLKRSGRFPKICFHCGGSTRRVTRVKFQIESYVGEGFEDGCLNVLLVPIKFVFFGIILQPVGLILQYFIESERWAENQWREVETLVFKIPHCKDCERLAFPNVVSADGMYSMVAHKSFRGEYTRENCKP